MQFHVYTFREHSRVLWGEGGVKHKETISLKKPYRVKGTHHKKILKEVLMVIQTLAITVFLWIGLENVNVIIILVFSVFFWSQVRSRVYIGFFFMCGAKYKVSFKCKICISYVEQSVRALFHMPSKFCLHMKLSLHTLHHTWKKRCRLCSSREVEAKFSGPK